MAAQLLLDSAVRFQNEPGRWPEGSAPVYELPGLGNAFGGLQLKPDIRGLQDLPTRDSEGLTTVHGVLGLGAGYFNDICDDYNVSTAEYHDALLGELKASARFSLAEPKSWKSAVVRLGRIMGVRGPSDVRVELYLSDARRKS